jgi:ABC-type lipoprotein release transport system permease subunit
MNLFLTLAQPNTTVATTFSVGSMIIIALPLVGVIITLAVTNFTTQRAEDRRARNLVHVQVLEAGRDAELKALFATAEFIAKLKVFHRSMSGNSGKGEDDKRSAKAAKEFFDAYGGSDPLTQAAITVEALGALNVSNLLKGVRKETLDYLRSLETPTFRAKEAQKFEERVDSLMRDLVDEVRLGFGTDEARARHQRKTGDNRNGG